MFSCYLAAGVSQNVDVGFQPDLTWIKGRNLSFSHQLNDSVRGAGYALASDSTNAEANWTSYFTDFISTPVKGFELTGGLYLYNLGTYNYVAWNWKAGGTAVSNTDGTIDSQVSANPDAGFSIVSWTGDNTIKTIGHGLSKAPELVIRKRRDGSGGSANWVITGSAIGSQKYMYFLTNAAGTWSSIADDTNTVINGWGVDSNNGDMIAYCFHSVDGYSKVGSYTGNSSADGTFVHCGFAVSYVLAKMTSSPGSDWSIYDNERTPYNPNNITSAANASSVEETGRTIDMLSNGFKFRVGSGTNPNVSGKNYIFIAFAEHPFKYSTAK